MLTLFLIGIGWGNIHLVFILITTLEVGEYLTRMSWDSFAYVYFQSPWGVAFYIFPRVLVVISGARGSGGLAGPHVAPGGCFPPGFECPHFRWPNASCPAGVHGCLLSRAFSSSPTAPLPSLVAACSFLASISFPLHWNVRARPTWHHVPRPRLVGMGSVAPCYSNK